MTIANWVSLGLVAAFPLFATLAGVPLAEILEMHVACGAAVLVLTFTLFAFGWIGGGDAKLAAATAVWLGWDNLYDYALVTSVIGGALTLGLVHWRRWALPAPLARRSWITRLHAPDSGVPYGIALAIGGLALYPDSTLWSALVHA